MERYCNCGGPLSLQALLTSSVYLEGWIILGGYGEISAFLYLTLVFFFFPPLACVFCMDFVEF